MKKLNVLATSAAVAGALLSGTAAADFTGNIGLSNNYMWRGVTQTDDQAAISGGLDYSNESGIYVGTWISNTDFGDTAADGSYEMDLYFGYGGEAGSVAYDIGYIYYAYPLDTDLDFSEIYAGVDVASFEFDLALTVDSDAGGDDSNIYGSIAYTFDLGNDLTLGLLYGTYMFDADTSANPLDYSHYSVALGKGDFSFGLQANDITGDDDMRAVVSWGKEFEL